MLACLGRIPKLDSELTNQFEVNPMKLTTTQPAQPIDLPPVPPSFNTPTEIIIYLTLIITLSTNTLEALTDLLEKLKTLHQTWKPNRTKPKKRSKK
jgi:hypothetical protein